MSLEQLSDTTAGFSVNLAIAGPYALIKGARNVGNANKAYDDSFINNTGKIKNSATNVVSNQQGAVGDLGNGATSTAKNVAGKTKADTPSGASAVDGEKASNLYSNLQDSKFVGEGKKFTSIQKKNIIQQNMERNGGVIKSDLSGEILVPATQSKKGVTLNPLEAQIDHIHPRSKGGSNSYSNAQILSRDENIRKSNK